MDVIVIVLLIVLVIHGLLVSNAAKTREKVKDRFDIDSKIIYLEEKRDVMTVEEKRDYIIHINDYRNKLNSSKFSSIFWMTRLFAKSELENSCIIIEVFYDRIKSLYGD